MTPKEVAAATFRWFPESFWKRMIRALFQAHQVSHELMYREYAPPEAENLLGVARRGKVEEYMRGTAALFPGMMSSSVERPKGPWNHTEVRSGPMILTASTVQTPCEMVDKADFRVSLAEDNNTLNLFPDEDATTDDHSLYAVLLHSRYRGANPDDNQRYAHLPGSAYLAFPSAGFNYYLHTMNLFDQFPAEVAGLTPKEWDQEARVRYLCRARRTGVI